MLVGFAMISDNIAQPMDDIIGPYYLWKLLIEHCFQRHGCARVNWLAKRPWRGEATEGRYTGHTPAG